MSFWSSLRGGTGRGSSDLPSDVSRKPSQTRGEELSKSKSVPVHNDHPLPPVGPPPVGPPPIGPPPMAVAYSHPSQKSPLSRVKPTIQSATPIPHFQIFQPKTGVVEHEVKDVEINGGPVFVQVVDPPPDGQQNEESAASSSLLTSPKIPSAQFDESVDPPDDDWSWDDTADATAVDAIVVISDTPREPDTLASPDLVPQSKIADSMQEEHDHDHNERKEELEQDSEEVEEGKGDQEKIKLDKGKNGKQDDGKEKAVRDPSHTELSEISVDINLQQVQVINDEPIVDCTKPLATASNNETNQPHAPAKGEGHGSLVVRVQQSASDISLTKLVAEAKDDRFRFLIQESIDPSKLEEDSTKRRHEFRTRFFEMDCRLAGILVKCIGEGADRHARLKPVSHSACEQLERVANRYLGNKFMFEGERTRLLAIQSRMNSIHNKMVKNKQETLKDLQEEIFESLHSEMLQTLQPSIQMEIQKADKRECTRFRKFETSVGTSARRFYEEAATRKADEVMLQEKIDLLSQPEKQVNFLEQLRTLRVRLQDERDARRARDAQVLSDIHRVCHALKRAVLETVGNSNV